MAEVLTEDELAEWPPGFLSELSPESPALTPAEFLDPADGQPSHLYGLGLSGRIGQAIGTALTTHRQ